MEVWHRLHIDGIDASYWQNRGLKMRPILSALDAEGRPKTWVAEASESSEVWADLRQHSRVESFFVSTHFTDQERLAAEWCILRGSGPLRPNEPEDWHWSSEYIQDGCSLCGSGWRQIAPFRLKTEARAAKNAFLSFNASAFELFVTSEVSGGFQEAAFRGFATWPLLVGKDRHPTTTGVRQLMVENVAPPALAMDRVEREDFQTEICEGCGRAWHTFYRRGMMPLHRAALLTDVDFQLTNEWFGSGRAARREILVSRRVVEAILTRKWKGAELSPVELV